MNTRANIRNQQSESRPDTEKRRQKNREVGNASGGRASIESLLNRAESRTDTQRKPWTEDCVED